MKFAKHSGAEVIVEGSRVTLRTSPGLCSFTEVVPDFNEAGWAAWIAFRLLHPAALDRFDKQMYALFAKYRAGEGKWISYNEEKREILRSFLTKPYNPKMWRER